MLRNEKKDTTDVVPNYTHTDGEYTGVYSPVQRGIKKGVPSNWRTDTACGHCMTYMRGRVGVDESPTVLALNMPKRHPAIRVIMHQNSPMPVTQPSLLARTLCNLSTKKIWTRIDGTNL